MEGVPLRSRLGEEGVQTGETACAKALRHRPSEGIHRMENRALVY